MNRNYLTLAIVFKVGGTTCMKLSVGFTRPVPALMLFICYGLCFIILAVKRIDLSVAYTVWVEVSTLLTAVVGMIWLDEPVSPARITSISLIAAGVIGLHYFGNAR